MPSLVPYYYAPDGNYVLFLGLLGFTHCVRHSFQKRKTEDETAEAWQVAQRQFKESQAEVDKAYRRFQRHLGKLLRGPCGAASRRRCRSSSQTAPTSSSGATPTPSAGRWPPCARSCATTCLSACGCVSLTTCFSSAALVWEALAVSQVTTHS